MVDLFRSTLKTVLWFDFHKIIYERSNLNYKEKFQKFLLGRCHCWWTTSHRECAVFVMFYPLMAIYWDDLMTMVLFTCSLVTWIILRPLALSLDEGLNALSGKNPSAAGWFSRPIKCQILARMRISHSLYFRL